MKQALETPLLALRVDQTYLFASKQVRGPKLYVFRNIEPFLECGLIRRFQNF